MEGGNPRRRLASDEVGPEGRSRGHRGGRRPGRDSWSPEGAVAIPRLHLQRQGTQRRRQRQRRARPSPPMLSHRRRQRERRNQAAPEGTQNHGFGESSRGALGRERGGGGSPGGSGGGATDGGATAESVLAAEWTAKYAERDGTAADALAARVAAETMEKAEGGDSRGGGGNARAEIALTDNEDVFM